MTLMKANDHLRLPSFEELTLQLGRGEMDSVPRSVFINTEISKELPRLIQRQNDGNFVIQRLKPAMDHLNECLKSCGTWLHRVGKLGEELQNCYQPNLDNLNPLTGLDYFNVVELNNLLNNSLFDAFEDDMQKLIDNIRAVRNLASKSYIYSEQMEARIKSKHEFVSQTTASGSFTYTNTLHQKSESNDKAVALDKFLIDCNNFNPNLLAPRKSKIYRNHRRAQSSPLLKANGRRGGFKRRTSSLSSPELHQLLVFCQRANQNDINKVLDLEVDPLKVAPSISLIKKIKNPSYSSSGGLNTVLSLPAKVLKCSHCETENSPEWRKGPEGKQTLCNACGLFYAKLARKYGLKKAASLLLEREVPRNIKFNNP